MEATKLTEPRQSQRREQTPRKVTFAASIGHVVEFYDFSIYALLAPVLAPIFFPSKDHITSLVATFGVFGVAFVIRPLGGIVFGHLADKIGRKNTLSTVILLMSAATAAIGLLPGQAQIGVLAPVLLVVCRSLQGLSTGGEFGGSASLVAEHAPPDRRGFLTSWVISSSGLGMSLGALIGALLTSVVSHDALSHWGWRIPFLVAVPLGAAGLYLRLRLEDAPSFKAAKENARIPKMPVLEALRSHHRAIATLIGMVVLLTTSIYVLFSYMTAYLNTFLDVPLERALPASLVGFMLFFALGPVFGRLSDNVGRKPVLVCGAIAHIVTLYPAFKLLQERSFLAIAVSYAIFALIYAMYVGPFTAAIVEQFPVEVRAASLGIGYNLPICVFGGLSPLAMTYLVHRFHNPMIPAFYVMGGAVVSLLVILSLKNVEPPCPEPAS